MLIFRFQTSYFDEHLFQQRLLAAAREVSEEAARLFLREMYRFFTKHTWSGAAQATLVPLSQAARTVFTPTPPKPGWETSYWAQKNANNEFWWSQHGLVGGIDFGRGGLISGTDEAGETFGAFIYGHGLLHFTQNDTPNHWTILEELQNRLGKDYILLFQKAVRRTLKQQPFPIVRNKPIVGVF